MGDKKDEGGFDIDFKVLPPELQVKLWLLSLDADTSKVTLAYNPGKFVMNIGYSYGGSIESSFLVRRFSAKLGVNPSSREVDLGLVFRGFKFSASTSVGKPTLGLGISYGSGLLPFPSQLGSTFTSAAGGLSNIAGDLSSAPDNPLAWYNLHSDDVESISKAVSLGQQIMKAGSDKNRFGVGLRLNYTSESGLTIYGGAQLRF
ncbi:hypothetical protein Pan44_38360 [Caulifigura coniformis]|uniref:Porin domain-containing protein n=1 Tax=Caulifigura coniformis TaxID=2527983 RepID=A0A517SI39_9PLAN|nr:hypothetical protein [Caulifigura coniformis]QDT55788.1 hypothetical protein Pan44_38360 [Caulifigura coniformis]